MKRDFLPSMNSPRRPMTEKKLPGPLTTRGLLGTHSKERSLVTFVPIHLKVPERSEGLEGCTAGAVALRGSLALAPRGDGSGSFLVAAERRN